MLHHTRTSGTKRSSHRVRGFSLIEVMIAAAIAASGLAGIAMLLVQAVAGTGQSAWREQAALAAASLSGYRALSPQLPSIAAGTDIGVTANCLAPQVCTAQQFARQNWLAWQSTSALVLPAGSGILCRDTTPFDGDAGQSACDGGGRWTVKLFWQSPTAGAGHLGRHVQTLP